MEKKLTDILILFRFIIYIFICTFIVGFIHTYLQTSIPTLIDVIQSEFNSFLENSTVRMIMALSTGIYHMFWGFFYFIHEGMGWFGVILGIGLLLPFWGWALHLAHAIIVYLFNFIFGWLPALIVFSLGCFLKLTELFCGWP